MKITLFTSNNTRHNYLINLLSRVCKELYVVQECNTIFPGLVPDHYPASKIMQKYFDKVYAAQKKLFGNPYINCTANKIKLLPVLAGEINNCSLKFLKNFLKSEIYIVYGSSYIKGDLVNFLVKKRAINIHMGVSPYYRGTDCNFWALYQNNPHLVGATIHYLTKGLDNGPMLYHAVSNIKKNPFEYTMSTVKAAFHSLADRIKDKSILKLKPLNQERSKEINYSKKIEFNNAIVSKYFKKQINLKSKKIDISLLKDPYFLKR